MQTPPFHDNGFYIVFAYSSRKKDCEIWLFRALLHESFQYYYNGPPVKTTHEKIITNQIIPYQPILSPEPPWYRNERSNCPAEQGGLDRLGLGYSLR